MEISLGILLELKWSADQSCERSVFLQQTLFRNSFHLPFGALTRFQKRQIPLQVSV